MYTWFQEVYLEAKIKYEHHETLAAKSTMVNDKWAEQKRIKRKF